MRSFSTHDECFIFLGSLHISTLVCIGYFNWYLKFSLALCIFKIENGREREASIFYVSSGDHELICIRRQIGRNNGVIHKLLGNLKKMNRIEWIESITLWIFFIKRKKSHRLCWSPLAIAWNDTFSLSKVTTARRHTQKSHRPIPFPFIIFLKRNIKIENSIVPN